MRSILLIGFLLVTSRALALPTWSVYRTMPETSRLEIDAAMSTLVEKIEPTGFKTMRLRFCHTAVAVWETSPNASCESTRMSATLQTWPPVRTSELLNFAWITHVRFALAYCDQHREDPACTRLGILTSSGPSQPESDADAASFETDRHGTFRFLQLARLASLFVGKPASAAEVCQVENDQLMTKSGATIFLDFGVQPGKTHVDSLTELAKSAADDRLPDSAIRDGTDSISKIGKVLTTRYRERLPWVQERVRKDKVSWIGTELSTTEMGDRTGRKFLASFNGLKDQLIARKITKTFARDAMVIGACPTAPACAWLQDASLRASVALIPLAADDVKTEALKFEEAEVALLNELLTLVKTGKMTGDDFGAIEREYRNLFLATDPPDAKARSKARRSSSVVEVSKAKVALYDLAIVIGKNRVARDQAIVAAALAQPGNGILAMGVRARDKIVPLLEAACRGPIASPRSSVVPSGRPARAADRAGRKSPEPKPAAAPAAQSVTNPTVN